jgi:hypothetical protein
MVQQKQRQRVPLSSSSSFIRRTRVWWWNRQEEGIDLGDGLVVPETMFQRVGALVDQDIEAIQDPEHGQVYYW